MSDYYRCTCGNHLEKVTQSANSMLNSEQFDAARMGDWFCRRCPKNEGKNRYFWDSEVAALAAAPAQPDAGVLEDAARYQLLRRGQHWSVVDGIGNDLRAEALDAAVDAARKQGGA